MYLLDSSGSSSFDAGIDATAAVTALAGEAVLVLPGFLGSDLSTAPLRSILRNGGYDALPWKFGPNLGPSRNLLTRLREHVERLATARRRPVSLVGHSLGGLYAREIAKIAPELVRIVVTLGSPIRALEPNNPHANLDIVRTIERTCGRTVAELQQQGMFCNLAAPLDVPCVAIYSKRDRVAPWQTCLQAPALFAHNVEVDATHLGMLINTSVGRVVRDQLAYEGTLQ